MASRPILRLPNYVTPFFMALDVSKSCTGGCLFQDSDGIERSVGYLRQKVKVMSCRSRLSSRNRWPWFSLYERLVYMYVYLYIRLLSNYNI